MLLRTFDEYYHGYTDEKGKPYPGYKDLVETLLEDFPLGERIISEEAKKKFIRLYGTILKATNVLSTFDQFAATRFCRRATRKITTAFIWIFTMSSVRLKAWR